MSATPNKSSYFVTIARLTKVLVISASVVGCAGTMRDQGLEGVAKEWSKAIRASQVIPVYPLSEDIQVGDVYIVDVPSGQEQELWRSKGYLPLPQLFTRLDIPPAVYVADMYRGGAYGVDGSTGLPLAYQKGSSEQKPSDPTTIPSGGNETQPRPARRPLQNWQKLAPQASFPSYSVKVGSSSGGSLGLPIQGIPVALGLLNSQSAVASVSMQECYTYGLPNLVVLNQIRAATQPSGSLHKCNLSMFAPQWSVQENGKYAKRYRYIRVITQVYTIGRIHVNVADNSSSGGNVEVGLKQNLMLADGTGTVSDLLKKTLESLDGTGPTTAPNTKPTVAEDTGPTTAPTTKPTVADGTDLTLGARLKFVVASDRSISMIEEFEKPLVVGYKAIDLPIGDKGVLGGIPVDTFYGSVARRDGIVFLGRAIAEYVTMHPDGADRLLAWAQYGENNAWLRSMGFSDYADCPENLVSLYRTGYKWYKLPFNPATYRSWDEVQRRIAGDLLFCPPGLDRDIKGTTLTPGAFIQQTR
jgi:hypothetical protein